MTSTALARPGAVASPRLPVRMSAACFRWRARPGHPRPACAAVPVRPVVLERAVACAGREAAEPEPTSEGTGGL